MARTKATASSRQTPAEIHAESNGIVHRNGSASKSLQGAVGNTMTSLKGDSKSNPSSTKSALMCEGPLSLLFCVGGIYLSFLTWEVLRERITTTTYGTIATPEKFKYPVFTNTVQSAFAAVFGFIYLLTSTSHPHKAGRPAPIFPTSKILPSLLLISITGSLAAPFGYASLGYVDYVTFLLAKSCKLLPVMLLHTTVFRKRYPLYKYCVVALVTLGVAVFTLHHPAEAAKAVKHNSKKSAAANVAEGVMDPMLWGLVLLGINLLFDGITNSTQDYIFTAFKPYTGPQMMSAHNIMSTLLTTLYLVAQPYIAPSIVGQYLGMATTGPASNELTSALQFIQRNPQVGRDILLFSLFGAIGQIFIFHTLQVYSSLLLVTVTVTRKMMSMILSVVWFGHCIGGMQWVGVGLVFGGIGAEAVMGRIEKKRKERLVDERRVTEEGKRKSRGF